METPMFATCTYQEFDPSYGIPVRSTVGHPRFRLRYDLAAVWPFAAPERAFMNAPRPIFREQYFAKLDRFGVEKFRQQARNLAIEQLALNMDTDRSDVPIVLLCFEKLWLDQWCHRTMFAEWWEEQTGEEVPEFGRTKHHDRKSLPVPEGLW